MKSREKVTYISNTLMKKKKISFRLYNVLYTISFSGDRFFITYTGTTLLHEYATLKDLFENYRVYGFNLFELIDDIKIDLGE